MGGLFFQSVQLYQIPISLPVFVSLPARDLPGPRGNGLADEHTRERPLFYIPVFVFMCVHGGSGGFELCVRV